MKKKTIYLLFPLLSLCGCSVESDIQSGQDEEIVLNSRIDDVTADLSRAPIEKNHASKLNVAFARINQTGESTWETWGASTLVKGARAAASGTTAITFTTEQYYSNKKTSLGQGYGAKFIGWYPDITSASGKVTFNIDGKTDIMWTSSLSGSHSDKFNGTNKVFAFAHRLSRITVYAYGDAQAATNWGTLTSVRVWNTPVSCVMTLADAPTVDWGSIGSITLKNPTNDADMSSGVTLTNKTIATAAICGYAMLAPQASYTLEVTTSLGGTRQVMVYPSGGFLSSTHYAVYLNFQSSTISPYATVAAWTNSSDTPTGTFPN